MLLTRQRYVVGASGLAIGVLGKWRGKLFASVSELAFTSMMCGDEELEELVALRNIDGGRAIELLHPVVVAADD